MAFSTLLSLSVIGALLMVILATEYIYLVPVFLTILRIGIAGSFNLAYLANVDVFPTLFSGSAIGICNFFARICTTLAP